MWQGDSRCFRFHFFCEICRCSHSFHNIEAVLSRCGTETGMCCCSHVTPKPRFKSSAPSASSRETTVSTEKGRNGLLMLTRLDSDAPPTHDHSSTNARFASNSDPASQLPVLTTFVGSLVQNAPFRVSIHNWDRPRASRMLEDMAKPGDSITFEARVYIDGVSVA